MTSEGPLPEPGDENEKEKPEGRGSTSSDEKPRAAEPAKRSGPSDESCGSVGSDQADSSDVSDKSDTPDVSDSSERSDTVGQPAESNQSEQSNLTVPSLDEVGRPPPEDPLAWHPRLREAVDLLAGYSSPDLKEALISMNFVTERDLLEAFATEYRMERVDWDQITVTRDLLAQMPDELAWKHHVFPVRFDETTLWVALADPLGPSVFEEIQERVHKKVVGMIASEGEILRMLGMHYG